jgi:hypothetical protein
MDQFVASSGTEPQLRPFTQPGISSPLSQTYVSVCIVCAVCRNQIEPGGKFAPEAGRYHLYISYACPWACRTVAVMHMKVSVCGGGTQVGLNNHEGGLLCKEQC